MKKTQNCRNRLKEGIIVKRSAEEEAWLKQEEMCKERLDTLETALKDKTDKLIQHLN